MTEDEKSRSWWTSMPGMLTGIAAILTAFGGLVGILYQNGVIDGHKNGGSVAPAAQTISQPAQTPSPVSTGSGSASRESGNQPKGWSDANAIITAKSGATTTVRADTLTSCISVSPFLTLSSGQEVPFEKMRSFEVLDVDPLFTPKSKAKMRITLLDGKTLEENVNAECPGIVGYNDLGRFSINMQDLKQIEFRR